MPPLSRVLFQPHTGYKHYRLPMFIIHASDTYVTLVSELGEWRIIRLDEMQSSDRVIYSCVEPDTLLIYGNPELWTVRTWNGKISSMEYGGAKVYPLSTAWDESVWDFFTWLDGMGVAASSLNTMSLNLWRTTLPKPVSFHEEAPLDRMLGPVAIRVGGRKEAKRGTYRNRVEYDMVAAYPNAMADPFPSQLAPVSDSFIRDMDIDKWEGIAIARVRIPPMEWGPLPVMLDSDSEVTCYGFTGFGEWATVCLTLSELRFARDVGCDYRIIRCNIGMDRAGTFHRWLYSIVPMLRGIPGSGGVVGKLVANRLWSSFAVSPYGVRKEHRVKDGRLETTVIPPDPTGQVLRRAATCYLGAMVQGRVRERLYREGLLHFRDVVYIDTDGLVAKPATVIPEGWRAKTAMRHLEVAGPQAIRYYCKSCHAVPGGHDGPHYTVAGATTVEAKSRLFRLFAENPDTVIVTNLNTTLPLQDVNRALTKTSFTIAGDETPILFGPPSHPRQNTA